jgi:hypothetical protein
MVDPGAADHTLEDQRITAIVDHVADEMHERRVHIIGGYCRADAVYVRRNHLSLQPRMPLPARSPSKLQGGVPSLL